MANWEEFKYAPEWQGPLPGRSFEKQTEDAINRVASFVDSRIEERIEDTLASAAIVLPYDAAPEPAGTPFSGLSVKYARGDHVHPKQSDCMSAVSAGAAGKLDPGFTLRFNGIPAGGDASNTIASGAVSMDGLGTREIIVAFSNATEDAPGLMSPADKAALGGAATAPRLSGVSVSNADGAVVKSSGSAAIPAAGAVLAFNAGSGVAVALNPVTSGGTQVLNVNIGADFSASATAETPGFMAASDKATLGSAFISAAVDGGTLYLYSDDSLHKDPPEPAAVLPVGEGGGGGGGGGEGANFAPLQALESVSGTFDFLPARLTPNRQELLLFGVGTSSVQLASGAPLFRSLVQYYQDFSTEAYPAAVNVSMNCLVDLGNPDIIYAAVRDTAAVATINAAGETGVTHRNKQLVVASATEGLDERWTIDDVNAYYRSDVLPGWWSAGDEVPAAPTSTDEFGTFDVTWGGGSTSAAEGEPLDYHIDILWTPQWEYLTKKRAQGLSVTGQVGGGTASSIWSIASGASDAPTLQDGVAYTTPWFNTTAFQPDPADTSAADVATLGVVLSINAGALASGMSRASVSANIAAEELTADTPYIVSSGLPIDVVWSTADDDHVDGATSAYGTVSIAITRRPDDVEIDPDTGTSSSVSSYPWTYSASVEWAPNPASVPPLEGALTLRENRFDGGQRVEDINFSAIATPFIELQSAFSAVSAAGISLGGAAIVSVGAGIEVGRSGKHSPEPFAMAVPSYDSSAGGMTTKLAKFSSAMAAYVVSGASPASSIVSWGGSQFFFPTYSDAEEAASAMYDPAIGHSSGSVVMPRDSGARMIIPSGATGAIDLYAKMDSAEAIGSTDPDTGRWSGGWSTLADMTSGGNFCSVSIPVADLPQFTAGASRLIVDMAGSNHDSTTFTVTITREDPAADPEEGRAYYVAAQWWYPETYSNWGGYEPYANAMLTTVTAAGDPGPTTNINIAQTIKFLVDNADDIKGW